MLAFVALKANAQWEVKTVDNGFDAPFKVAYSKSASGKEFIKLWKNDDGTVGLLMYEGYMCSERPYVEMTFIVNGEYEKYDGLFAVTAENKKQFYILSDVSSIETDFRQASEFKIRVTDGSCGMEIYTFDMTGSSAALDFMLRD